MFLEEENNMVIMAGYQSWEMEMHLEVGKTVSEEAEEQQHNNQENCSGIYGTSDRAGEEWVQHRSLIQ